MKDWMTIGQLANLSGLSTKAIRLYEEKGILKSHSRSGSDYRLYTKLELNRAMQIKELRELGFTILEIASMQRLNENLDKNEIVKFLKNKKNESEANIADLISKKEKLDLIIASIEQTTVLNEHQRRYVMDNLRTQVKEELLHRKIVFDDQTERSIENEILLAEDKTIYGMVQTLRLIQSLAKDLNIPLGPGRGTAGGSVLLYALGFTKFFPLDYDLLPELFYKSRKPVIWIDISPLDVEKFRTELIKHISIDELKRNNVYIFECPFLEVLSKLQKKVGTINFDSYSDDSDEVLSPFLTSKLDDIFLFDIPKRSLMYANSTIDFIVQERDLQSLIRKELKTYKVTGSKDIVNLMTLSFPYENKVEQLNSYLSGKSWASVPEALIKKSKDRLSYTNGLLLYREQMISIICDYIGCTVAEANLLYFHLRGIEQVVNENLLVRFNTNIPSEIKDWILKNIKSVFLKSHMVSMWWFTKRSAIAQTLYPQEYRSCLEEWEKNHTGAWSDLGFIDRDYRPLALYW